MMALAPHRRVSHPVAMNDLDSNLVGRLLIAMPDMSDPRFAKTVIYMCAHSDEGCMGLIVNKPQPEVSFKILLEQMDIPVSENGQDVRVHFGGPVDHQRGFVLHSNDYESPNGTLEVDDEFRMTATLDVLEDIAKGEGPQTSMMALGYAGWGPGQLEYEIKQNGWLGGYALGASYIAFLWCTGHALFGELNWKVVVITVIYSIAGLGIAIVNDFKSVEGDKQFGLKSLPVVFGVEKAAWICAGMIDIFQMLIAGYLVYIHQNLYAAILVLLIIPQITLQDMYFLRDPLENDVKYQASAQPFLVLGMLVAGIALGHSGV